MNADDYQRQAVATAIYPGRNEMLGLTYVTLGLASEAGEVAGKVKKLLRDRPDPSAPLSTQDTYALIDETSDVLWYVAMVLDELGVPMGHGMQRNLNKLQSRQARGKIGGSGDDR